MPAAVSRCAALVWRKLSNTLAQASASLANLDDDHDAASRVTALLEDAGAQLGHLQVACCSPARTKLYASALENLARTQRLIKRNLDLDH